MTLSANSEFYFAYGSNMLEKQMSSRCPGARFYTIARKDGFELCFPQTSSMRGDKGVASIRTSPNSYIEGVVYQLTKDDLNRLDLYEAEGKRYKRDCVNLDSPDLREAKVWTYFAMHDSGSHYPPASEYINTIIQGAIEHGLFQEYIKTLCQFNGKTQ